MNKKSFTIIKVILGLSILFILFYKLGIKEIIDVLKIMNLWLLVPVYISIFISLLFSTVGIFALLKPFKKKIAFLKLYKYISLSWSIGLFFPSKVGELSLLYFFRKKKIETGYGSCIWFTDKLISVFVVSIISIIGFFIFFGKFRTILLGLIIVLFFLLTFVVMMSKKLRALIEKYILRKYAVYFKGFSKTFLEYFKNYKKELLVNLAVTFLRTLLDSFSVFLIFLAFNKIVPLQYILIIWAMEVIISLVPITINGLGIKQSVSAYLFSLIGVALPIIGARYVIDLVVRYSVGLFFIITTKRRNI